jgi:V8-like Glu-specific endopeptidase
MLPYIAPENAFSRDVAVIILSHHLTPRPVALAANLELPLNTALWHAGYSRDRRQDLTGHFECRLKRVEPALGIWMTDCDSNPGADGGPVFALEDGELRVAAILVTGAADNKFTVAVPLTDGQRVTSNRSCPGGEDASPGR